MNNIPKSIYFKGSLVVITLGLIGNLYFAKNTYKNMYEEESRNVIQIKSIVQELEEKILAMEEQINEKDDLEALFYVSKLKDQNFTSEYGHGYTWYIAAESLGEIGKPAIPHLINKLETDDDYERALVLYALLLATQHENVQEFAGRDYISVGLDFDATKHEKKKEIAYKWWEKYKGNF